MPCRHDVAEHAGRPAEALPRTAGRHRTLAGTTRHVLHLTPNYCPNPLSLRARDADALSPHRHSCRRARRTSEAIQKMSRAGKRQRLADDRDSTPFDSIKSRLQSSTSTTRKVRHRALSPARRWLARGRPPPAAHRGSPSTPR
jgi:hypothetical protein